MDHGEEYARPPNSTRSWNEKDCLIVPAASNHNSAPLRMRAGARGRLRHMPRAPRRYRAAPPGSPGGRTPRPHALGRTRAAISAIRPRSARSRLFPSTRCRVRRWALDPCVPRTTMPKDTPSTAATAAKARIRPAGRITATSGSATWAPRWTGSVLSFSHGMTVRTSRPKLSGTRSPSRTRAAVRNRTCRAPMGMSRIVGY